MMVGAQSPLGMAYLLLKAICMSQQDPSETCLLSIMHVIFQCILKEINITSLSFARIFHEVSGNSLESCGFCGFLAKGRLLGLWKEDSGQN